MAPIVAKILLMACLSWSINTYFSLLKGEVEGDKPLEIHAASNEEKALK